MDTFLESYDFTGKRIILFATSGGSGLGKTDEGVKKSYLKQRLRMDVCLMAMYLRRMSKPGYRA